MFLLAFILYPFVEIIVFLLVVRATSLSFALLLTLATSLLGFAIARLQHRGSLYGSTGFSADSLKNYLFANLGAFGLILPGFVTDVLGLLIAIPFTRRLLLAAIKFSRLDLSGKARGNFSVFKTWSFEDGDYQDQNPDRRDVLDDEHARVGRQNDDEPIDVDFVTKN